MKGEVRNPIVSWLLVFVTCGFYGYYWWFQTATELKNFLGKEEINPMMIVLLQFISCGLYGYFMAYKYGEYMMEARQKAGLPAGENQGTMYLVFMLLAGFGIFKMQEDLNKVWEGDAPASAA